MERVEEVNLQTTNLFVKPLVRMVVGEYSTGQISSSKDKVG